MDLSKIDHIGIAVENLEVSMKFYQDILGLELIGTDEVPSQKVKVAMFKIGESKIELLEPTSPSSSIAIFIQKKGEGIHHIAYSVTNVDGTIKQLKNKEVRMIDNESRPGAGGSKIAFIHPKASGRVLTELCQH